MAPQEQLRPEIIKTLEKVLQKLGVKNYSMKISCAVEKSQNLAAVLARINVNGQDNNGKSVHKSFIIKSAPDDEEIRNVCNIRDAFIREIYIYSKVFPEFDLLQREKLIVNPFKSYPEYYASTLSTGEECIVLEDLKALGYRHCNREKPVDFDHAVVVMKAYGRLHALSLACREQKPQIFEDIINGTHKECLQNFEKSTVRTFCKARIDHALKSLDPVNDNFVYNKFQEFSENMFDILTKCVDIKFCDEHAVIVHGDCSLSNFMFIYEDYVDPNKPTGMRFLDCQLARLGSPAMDLASFLFSWTDKNLRDLHYDDLINEYYNSACSMLEEFGTDPMKVLPFSVLQQHLKKYSIFGLFIATLLVFVQCTKKDRLSDIIHNTVQLFHKLKPHESYDVRMRDVILDFERFGYNFCYHF